MSAPRIRPDLQDVEPYRSPQRPARFRMNTNESPYPPPAEVIEEVEAALRETQWNRYPDHDASELLEALSQHTGCPRDFLWLANGSNELLLHLFLAYGGPGRTSVTFEPTYSLHTTIARITGTGTTRGTRDVELEIPADELDRVLEDRPDIVMLCAPNNPTGSSGDLDVLDHAAARAGSVVLDQAYVEFAASPPDARALLERHENLVIMRTFSKAWSLAGARLGYLMASPEIIEGLRKVRLPYHLSTFTQLVGSAMLRHADDSAELVDRIRTERDRIYEALTAMGVSARRSDANFVLFEVPDAHEVWQALLDRDVLVRDYSHVRAPAGGYLRVTAGLPEETDAFLDALEEVTGAVATI